MRIRSSTREPTSSDASTATSSKTERDAGSRIVRSVVLLTIGFAAIAYAVSRYMSDPEDVPSVENVQERAPVPESVWDRTPSAESVHERVPSAVREQVPSGEAVRERTTDAVPDEFQEIPIGGRGESGDEGQSDESDDATEVIDDAEANVDITDEDHSPEEIEERAEETVAEPGEIALDEDVADELVDDDIDAESDEVGEQDEDAQE